MIYSFCGHCGYFTYHYTLYHQIIGSSQNGREYLYEALDYVAKGKVKVMAEIFPLEDIDDAYEKVANGNVRFRAVINTIGY